MTTDPERRLEKARQHMDSIGHSDYERCVKAWDDVLEAERDLARSRNEPSADVIDLGLKWDTGAPLPHLLSNGSRAFVICHLGHVDPHWEGTSVTVVSSSDEREDDFAVIDVWGIASVRFGAPNDEAIEGHPLWG